ncbi:MAG: ATP-binding cassette domain-containing protein [Coriobacteriales bacterium]|nr:ATP-binding cassette domain-containing protein [Coriobacteriales bacterium]
MSEQVLVVSNLTKRFERKGRADVVVVRDVSFCVDAGECVGLVGGSGSGKSTIAQMVTRLIEATSGRIVLADQDVTNARGAQLRAMSADVQMVFQNPVSSFDPRRTLGEGIGESLRNRGEGKDNVRRRVGELLEQCGLPTELADRYPREVSGGQCQRAAIARALAPDPALVICDEATSALDVTVQAQIVALLSRIQRERGLALLFVCHDLALVQGFCDRVLVLCAGRIVEEGPARTVLSAPRHDYTRQLLASVAECGG